MKQRYDIRDITRLAGVTEAQIRYWDKMGLIRHSGRSRGRIFFDFQALVAFRTVKALLDRGISTYKVRKGIASLRRQLPEISEPLSELRIDVLDRKLVIGKNRTLFTAEGQLLLQFEEPRETRARAPVPFENIEEQFFRALNLEDEGRDDRAAAVYGALLARKPDHVDSMVNLGNIHYRRGSVEDAEAWYRKAIRLEPDHVEANYNLANLLAENGNAAEAVLLYRRAIREDPEFADAHFNLAQTLEGLGDRQTALNHWKIYLTLDGTGKWAEYVRTKIDTPQAPKR